MPGGPLEAKSHVDPWAWWRLIGSPTRVCGPMVLQSELAFRMFVRRHGVELCYTPMIVAADLVRAAQRLGETAALDFFYDGGRCPSDRPLIVQVTLSHTVPALRGLTRVHVARRG